MIAVFSESVSAFSNSKDVEDAHRRLDQKISVLEAPVRALKTFRNAIVLVSRLPPEILSTIFKLTAAMGRTNLCWVKVSHVRSHWRSVALECPSLWSHIDFSNLNWAEEMLKRSKMAPLILDINLDLYQSVIDAQVMGCLGFALKEISRVRELRVVCPRFLMNMIISDLSGPAHLLEKLCLSTTYSSVGILPAIFSGEPPRLRQLEISGIDLAWDSPLFIGLTQLKIHSVRFGARPSIDQLIGALESMPNLETLELHDTLHALPKDTSAVPPSQRIFELLHLSYISISSNVLECAHLLGHLSYPATTSIKLACKATDATDDFSSLLPTISCVGSTARGEASDHIRSLFMICTSDRSITLKAWSSPGWCMDTPTTPAQVHLELAWVTCGWQATKIASSICTTLGLQMLHDVHILCFEDFLKNAWLTTFGGLTKLKSIHVRCDYGDELVRALSAEIFLEESMETIVWRQSEPPQSIPPAVYFPALRQLAIEGWNFEEPESDNDYFDDFITCLMDRRESGVEIKELRLIRCRHLSVEQVDLLEEIVVDVHWDRVEHFTDLEEDDDSD